MSHQVNQHFVVPEWPSLDGDSIVMEDTSYLTPCWRHWINRQKVSGLKAVTWSELTDLWTAAFGATEVRAPTSTSVTEIEEILHESESQPRAASRRRGKSASAAGASA